MERRKFLIGAGSTVMGASALVGSGAFSSVTANRDAEVDLEDDAEAYLGLVPGQENGEYVQTQGGTSPDNTLMIEMNGQSNVAGGGTGVNAEAVSVFDDLFRILNQADDKKKVWLTHDTNNLPEYMEASDINFYASGGKTTSNTMEGENNSVGLTAGSAVHVGLEIDTTGADGDFDADYGHILEEITVYAENV